MKGPDDNDKLQAGELGGDPTEGCEEVQAADGGTEPDPEVCELLTWRWKDGERIAPVKSLRNVFTIIQHDPRWKRRLKHNTFSGRFELDGKPIRDEEETAAAIWIDEVYGMQAPVTWTSDAMRLASTHRPHHPVRAYLDALVWDGVERLPTMLSTYWGADDTDLIRAMGAAWMVGCVARVRKPGCQMDNALILVGGQGIGKSSSIRYGLVPESGWFDDGRLDFSGNDKDSLQRLGGKWIYEIAELVSIRKREVEEVRGFMTRTTDNYRHPYGRNPQDHPRQVVFVGTTNEDAFLRDPAGNRRFWAVRVSCADVAGLRRDRDQLWAEASARYARGEEWWLSAEREAELAEANKTHEEQDPWAEMIARAVSEMAPLSPFSVSDILDKLQIPAHQRGRGHDNRVSQVLKDLGCEKAGRASAKLGKARLWRRVLLD